VNAGPVTSCGTCGDTRLRTLLDLGDQPLAERETGERYPLGLLECVQCGLIQLSWEVDRAVVFSAGHPYATGNTKALRDHFRRLAAAVVQRLEPDDLVVDIGANDGTFLAAVGQEWVRKDGSRIRPRVLAVEPTATGAAICRARGVPVEQSFWSAAVARDIVSSLGHATVITASNVLAHVSDQHDFLAGVNALLAPGGTFITENHDAFEVVNGLQIDTVYHEHLRFYTPATLGYLLSMHGFTAARMESIDTHGGSFRTYAVRRRLDLQADAERTRDQLCRLLEAASEEGKIYGVGAATRATPLIHFARLGRWLDRIVEVPGSAKIGTMMPGTQIPVTDERDLTEDQPAFALLLCWHVADDVIPKLRAAGYRGKFIVPLPQPRIIHG
jgi:SAM-dependent methyltransferase